MEKQMIHLQSDTIVLINTCSLLFKQQIYFTPMCILVSKNHHCSFTVGNYQLYITHRFYENCRSSELNHKIANMSEDHILSLS